ncbi:MAG: type I restriction endonuclease subunit R, partial [Candidatus Electrothrix sp. AR3]|nr:type I restriction endonuclease subunit R [Candidatus Electrothrix sp. AR3]
MSLFAELGWQTISARQETFGPGSILGRETKGQAVLLERLRTALTLFNPTLPPEAINTALDELTRDRSAMSLEAANREIYQLLKEGLIVSVPDQAGGQKSERLQIMDRQQPERNDFLLVSQFGVVGSLYTCYPDLVGFVNGLPWVVIELKKPGKAVRTAFDENLTHYKEQIPALFWSNALLIASNGLDSRVGSLSAEWERWLEWKRIEDENEPRQVSLEIVLQGTCQPQRLLDLVENFTLFSEKAGLIKILAQNHQFIGVNNAITSMLEARQQGHGRGGVFWQTQGSGKSFSMVFFAQKVLRKLAGNWTFVIITDRIELDEQIASTFKSCGAVSKTEGETCHARSGEHLRELLQGNHRYVFTLIQKFQSPELLCERDDVIVLTDEAHRSQYDTLALNMRTALPKALFLAFTGTPLLAGEERTKKIFGPYVSIYD